MSLVQPVRLESGGQIQGFGVGEAHLFQQLHRRLDVRAAVPGAAAAVHYHSRSRGNLPASAFSIARPASFCPGPAYTDPGICLLRYKTFGPTMNTAG